MYRLHPLLRTSAGSTVCRLPADVRVDVDRCEDPAGDRVMITLDGKFLGDSW